MVHPIDKHSAWHLSTPSHNRTTDPSGGDCLAGSSESLSNGPGPHSAMAAARRPRWSERLDPSTQEGMVGSYCAARRQLQAALTQLDEHPLDPNHQDAAHRAHVALAQRKVPFLYRGMPCFTESMKIGCAGPLPALGVWRTLAFELAINAWPLGPNPSFKDIQLAIMQWAVGAVAGTVGEAALERLAKAWIETLPKQFRAVHPSAALPDRMVAKMNRIRAGWGDEVRAAVVQRQMEVTQIDSDSNSRLVMRAFAGSVVVRGLAQPPGSEASLLKSVTVGNLPPTLAGFAVGAVVTGNMVRAEIRVPRMETLNHVLTKPRHEWSEQAAMADAQTLPLFYVHHQTVRQGLPTTQHDHDRSRFSNWHLNRPQGMADFPKTLGTAASRANATWPARAQFDARGALQWAEPAAPTPLDSLRGSAAWGSAIGFFALARLMIKAWAADKSSTRHGTASAKREQATEAGP